MQIENENSLKAHFSNGINLFAGAGFSVLAKDRNAVPLPIGDALIKEICSHFNRTELIGLPLAQVSQILKTSEPDQFNNYLTNRFTIGHLDDRYESLENINITNIFTTNIDDIFTRIYSESSRFYLNDITLRGSAFRDRSAIDYCPLHGCVNHPVPNFIFTSIELSTAFQNSPAQFHYLVNALHSRASLFWGYSLADAGVLQSLNPHLITTENTKPRWIVLRSSDEASIAYFKSLGFFIIVAQTDEILEFVSKFKSVEERLGHGLTEADFSTGRIPKLHEVSVRPAEDFYRGQPPAWYDVLAGRIPRISHYDGVLDLIDGGRNVIIKGIPASGKTTLLMQLGAAYETKKVKLFDEYVTPEKAHNIINTIDDRGEVMIFIDNIADSIDSLEYLVKSKKV